MTALSNIPPHAVLPLSAYNLADLRRASESSEQTFLYADCSEAEDKKSLLAAIARGFSLPEHFGMNLDALYDCITELAPDRKADRPGFVIVLDRMPNTESCDAKTRTAILDVFRDAADYFDDHATAFRVFYSVGKQAA